MEDATQNYIEAIAVSIASEVAEKQPAAPVEEGGQDEQEPAQAEQEAPLDFPYARLPYAFAAVDINGSAVTEADLGEKQLFLTNHWATCCSSCVGGMPDLARVAEAEWGLSGWSTIIKSPQAPEKLRKSLALSSPAISRQA
jgi:hypothetical protein